MPIARQLNVENAGCLIYLFILTFPGELTHETEVGPIYNKE